LDFPETHLQMGGMALTMRNLPAAEGAFREAVRLDPQQIEAWVMLARIAAAAQGAVAAGAILDEALAVNPQDLTLQQLKAELDAAAQ
jgi:cytochrome c-type biogenesis protein CcmH/NrfG